MPEQPVVVFRASATDAAAAHALLTEYFASRAATFPVSMGDYITTFPDAARFVPPRGVFFVLEQTDAAGTTSDIGCGGIRLIDAPAGVTRFELKHLWLRPHARGLGLGRRLLAELEMRATAFGATELVLDTNATQEAATGLYRSSGFVEIAAYNDNTNATHWFAKNLTTELE